MKTSALLLLLCAAPAAAQDTLGLGALQAAAVRQDPRIRQLELQAAQTDLRLRNLSAGRLPQLSATGEATVQSEVASIPISLPGVTIPQPPKDRYEAAVNADWRFYDGGVTNARRGVERAQLAAERAQVLAELYPLRTEVTEAYFTALLLQERMREISVLLEDLEARLSEVRTRVRNGAALPGDTAAIRAEMLRAEQQRAELAADRRASINTLEELTGREIGDGDALSLPGLADEVARVRSTANGGIAAAPATHPQYAVFAAQRGRMEREAALLRARLRPQASAFGKLAYGRPGYQQFTRELHDYWIAGVRFQWAPWDWGTNRRELEALRIQRQVVDTEEAAFAARLQRQVQQPLQAMQRLQTALEVDDRIVALREQVARQARAQFAERAITASAYVDALTDVQEARVARLRHRVELERARAQYLTTLGVELR